MPLSPRAIDVHVHLPIAEWLHGCLGPYLESVRRFFGTELTPQSVDEMARTYREAGLQGILLGWDAERNTGQPALPNETVAEVCRRHPDLFFGFGSVDPARPDAIERLRAFPELGLVGLKLHPTLQGFDPADDRYMPFFEAVAELGLPIVTHTGTSGIGAGEPGGQGLRIDLCQPIRWDRIAAAFPQMRIMLAHVGAPWHQESLAMALHKTNVYVDISGWKVKYLPEDLLRDARRRLRRQVCFGTDYPMFDPVAQFADVKGLGLPAEVEEDLLVGNAQRFLAAGDAWSAPS